jgi:hypothetical protein
MSVALVLILGGGVVGLLVCAGIGGVVAWTFYSTTKPQVAEARPETLRATGEIAMAPRTDPVKKPDTSPRELLLGKWENQDAKMVMAFRDNGSLQMTAADAPEMKGTYQFLADDLLSVTLSLPDGQKLTQKLKLKVTLDELATTDEEGKVDRYKRSTAGASKTPDPVPAVPDTVSPEKVPGLLACWKFDEGKGTTAADTSKNGLKATLHGGRWVPGVNGTAVQFDKVGEYLDYGEPQALSFKAGASFTFTGWLRTVAQQGPIVSQRNSKDGGAVIDLSLSDGQLKAEVRADGKEMGNPAMVIGRPVNDGQWHHFALTNDGRGTIELFIDGATQEKDTVGNAVGAITTDLRALGSERFWDRVGFFPPEKCSWQGAIDEFCIFDRVLSTAEVRNLSGPRPFVDKPMAGDNPREKKPPAPPAAGNLGKLRLPLETGWKAEFQPFFNSWTIEKYTPGKDGFNESNRLTVRRLLSGEPAEADAFVARLKEMDFLDIGYQWTEVTARDKLADGFVIKGLTRDHTVKDAKPVLGLVVVRDVAGDKLCGTSNSLRNEAVRTEALEMVKKASLEE